MIFEFYMGIIVFIIILAILVLVHEFGHFIAAKKSSVKVEEFGFGFPPRIFGIKKGETLYSINAIPLGGFVKLYGEEYKEHVSAKLKKKAFSHKKPYIKAFIIIAGVMGNFLLGWGLISFLFTQGIPTPTNKVVVEAVQQGTPASKAGLKEKDIISKISYAAQTYPITATTNLTDIAKKFSGQKLLLTVNRNGKQIMIDIVPRTNPPAGQGPLGIVISQPFEEKKYSWYQAPIYGLIEAARITETIATELGKTLFAFVTFKKTQIQVAGPVGIAQYTGQAIKLGKNTVLELLALLSLNLAVVNILPFPALDGGRLIFVLYEWITKRKVNQTFEQYLNLIGIIILLTLAALITINDIIRIYK
jgi:regulator of sigma E protease